jgi:DNA invertase Pin-like site-specific DNA recombinase
MVAAFSAQGSWRWGDHHGDEPSPIPGAAPARTITRRRSHTKRRRRRGAIYARHSTKDQHSIEDQIRADRAWADANGVTVLDKHVFFDEAQTGKKNRRSGFTALKKAIEDGEVDVVIVFATNRLFRKTYKTLLFVEEEIVDRGLRCVFVKSGVDTDDREIFRKLLHMHALVDEMTVQTQVVHIQAAHEGQLRLGIVFGALTYGYTGEEIPGAFTRRRKPARKLVINPETAKVVKQVFEWFTRDGASIREIVRRLNQAGAPLPERRTVKRWSTAIVRRMLGNPRYTGHWRYGVTEVVWKNNKDYADQVERDEPLCVMQLEQLRIIDDQTWNAAAKGLLDFHTRSGRKSNDARRIAQSQVLLGLCFCERHDHVLYLAGDKGHYLTCPECIGGADRYLTRLLPRQRAGTVICGRIAELLRSDPQLVQDAVEACRRHAQAMQQPDPQELRDLTRQEGNLTKDIKFILDCPGDSDQDRAENQSRLIDLRRHRNEVQEKIRVVEKAMTTPVKIPTDQEVHAALEDLAQVLLAAGEDPKADAAARRVVRAVTGGKVVISQHADGSRRGLLRATIRVHLLAPVLEGLRVVAPEGDQAPEVRIDFKDQTFSQRLADEAKALWDQTEPMLEVTEIAKLLSVRHGRKIDRHLVTTALKHWFEARGLSLPDGRSRRGQIKSKSTTAPFKRIADQVMALFSEDLFYPEIASELKVDVKLVHRAIAYWHEVRGLPVPDGNLRRKSVHKKRGSWPSPSKCGGGAD